MKNILLTVFIFLTGFISAQTTAFNMDVSSGCAPLCINFSDQSANALSWSWDFGDASSPATQQNPSHCYNTPGVYTVTLTATFSNSTGTATGTVTVYSNPVAAFTFTNTGNNTVAFTDQSTGGVSAWYWIFGGTAYSTQQNPSYTYASPGADTVCLYVANAMGCADTTCQTIVVTGIQDAVRNINWNIYPNPSSGTFTLQLNSPLQQPEIVTIENTLGEIILRKEISENISLDLSGTASGIYFVRIGNGAARKLVIE